MRQLFKEFLIGSIYLKKVKKNLKDKRRSGRSNTATTDDNNISKIRAFIKSYPCTYDEIEAELQICRGTIHNIIHDCLKLKNFYQDGYMN